MQIREYEALISSCNKENAIRFLSTIFGKKFGGKEEYAAENISIIGSVTLDDSDGRPKPVLCCFKAIEKNLTERSSRRKQFDDSVKVLKQAFTNNPYMGNGPVNGVFTQGLFFFCDANGNFRLSLVTSEIANGKHELNNYRRQSFFVESGAQNNTFRHRLCKRISNFTELKEAFNVEKLSDDFFHEYKVFYEDIVQYITGARFIEDKKNHYIREELSAPCGEIFNQFVESYKTTENAEKAVRNYVKKLMGRLVFVQFLQKKGWLGIPAEKNGWKGGDTRFLQNLFKNASGEEKNDFIDKVLEDVLFYAFNTKEINRKFKNKLLKQYKYPFLNGGLFEMDSDDKLKFALPAEAFSNGNREFASTERKNPYNKNWVKKRKPYFNIEACGLFDFFDRYNFTIDENDPTDAEVSVDPEMLGKIFENLLEDNKDKGAFYTPKEIVNYMVNESLIAYLDQTGKDSKIRDFVLAQNVSDFDLKKKSLLNEKLENVKICDPAIGSGAFPMGILNVLVKCRRALSDLPDEKNALANFKRHIIQNNIYGVDIEKGAVDIARLRFWLSLVVDEEMPEALPNLDFKIMQGNSLLECYEGIDLSVVAGQGKKRTTAKSSSQVSLVFDEAEAMKQIQKDLNSYFQTQDHDKKNSLKNSISEGVKNYLKFIAPEKRKEIDSMDFPNDKFFLWHTYFYDVFKQGGFDIVIGNPPYIPLQDNNGLLADIYERQDFAVFERGGDIYSLFYEEGIRLLRENGNLCYITSCQWIRAGYGEKLRGYLATKTNPEILIDFTGVKVFDGATVDPSILLVKNCHNKGATISTMTKPHGKEILPYLDQFVKQNATPCSFMGSESWVILKNDSQKLKDKIKETGVSLGKLKVNIYRGVLTGCNEAFIISDEKRTDILSKCNSADERKRTEKLIQPVLRGRDIRKFGLKYADLYLIATLPSRNYNIEDYIALKKYFLKFGMQRLEQTGNKYTINNEEIKARKKTNNKWFETQDSISYWDKFNKPKIVYPETTVRRSEFFYDESGILLDKTCFFISGVNLKFIQGILVSKVMEWFLERECRLLGKTTIQYSKQWMENIPIPSATKEDQQSIIDLVDKILVAKKKNPQADTSDLESQIDKLVYKLYDLSRPEIEVIEKSSAQVKENTENNTSTKTKTSSKKKYLVTTDEEL